MPITDREWEQINVAIKAMSCISLVGAGDMVRRDNILAVLHRWREDRILEQEIPPCSVTA